MYDHIWNAIDEEIARLRQAHALLLEGAATGPTRRTAKKASARAIKSAPRRTLSAKARHAIAEAQRKRWAKVKAQKKSAATQESAAKAGKT